MGGIFGIFDRIRKNSDVVGWYKNQVTKMSSEVANAIRHIFQVKWSYSARRDAVAYLELFHTSPRLAPVDIISTDCANTPFKVFLKSDLRMGKEDAEPVEDHPIYDLLDNPIPSRPDIDGFTVRYLTYVWWELQGDCYWIVVKDAANRPREIYPIPSNWVISAPTISIPYFLVMPQGNTASQTLLIDPSCVAWFKSPNVAQPYARGRGRAEAVGDELESDEYAAKYAKNLFFNDGTPKSIVIAPGATQETLQQLKTAWNQNYQGVANAQKTAFLGADMKLQTVGITPKEMDFIESRKFERDMVNQFWQMPPEIFGINDSSNRSTIDAARYLYTINVMSKRLMRFDSMINRQLMPMFDSRYAIKSDNVVPEDKEAIQKSTLENWNAGLITRGEARTKIAMEKLDNAKDDELKQTFSDVFENVNSTGAKPDETGDDQQSGDDAAKPPVLPADTSQPSLDEPLPVNPDEEVQVNGTPGLMPVGSPEKRHKGFTEDQRRKAWQRFDKAATAEEGHFKKAVRKIADSQQSAFDDAFNSELAKGTSPTVAVSIAQMTVFGDDEDRAVKKQLYASWMSSMKGGQGIANDMAGVDVGFTVTQPVFRAWIDEHGLEKAKEINGTTQELLAKSLGDGIEAGESILDLQKRLDDQFDGLRDYRSERIARTESAGSMNFGSTATYKSAGVNQKEFLSVQDDRTRDAHLEADGQIVGIDEPFIVDGEELQYPGDPSGSEGNVINCFLPETVVEGCFTDALKTFYSGDVVTIKTMRGYSLTVTANHPILTTDGWVRAKDLRKGMNAVADVRNKNGPVGLVDVDNQYVPATISQIFDALGANGAGRSEVVGGLDFYGDGKFGNGNVQIVNLNGELPLDLKSMNGFENRGDVYLVESSSGFVLIRSNGSLEEFSSGNWRSPPDMLSPFDLAANKIGKLLHFGPLEALGLGSASDWNPGFLESPQEDRTADPTIYGQPLQTDAGEISIDQGFHIAQGQPVDENTSLIKSFVKGESGKTDFLGKLINASSGKIAPDEIVEISKNLFTGHVYDLQAIDKFILSNGIVSSNCRCSILPVITETGDEE